MAAAPISNTAADDVQLPPSPESLPPSSGKKGKRDRRESTKAPELSITSLMDAFTILLVFLLMNFAADPTQITQSDDLQLVDSTESQKPEQAVAVAITRKNILLNGKEVVPVQSGEIDPNFKRDGAKGFFITRLSELLGEEAKKQEALERAMAARNGEYKFEGKVLVIADGRIPFRLLTEVLYTSAQSKFSKFLFAVIAE